MPEQQGDSASYYDKFNAVAKKTRINERIIGLYHRVLKNGFDPDSSTLEIGCGPGKLTYLLSKKLRKGSLESADLSPASVALAKSTVTNPNVTFLVSDALELKPGKENYQTILLFDVIEHIPQEKHAELFKKISGWLSENGNLLINIPNPDYILFARKYRPESLQIIDQPIFLDKLSEAIYAAGMEIDFLETYSIWAEKDYQFMIVKKQREFREIMLHTKRNFVQKVKSRILREINGLKYKQPKQN